MNNTDWPNVTVIQHPIIQQHLAEARDVNTSDADFRRLIGQIASLMAYEITRDCPTATTTVTTPLGEAQGHRLARELTLIPILRAGLGMCDPILQLFPFARVGHIGFYRDEKTLQPVFYYKNLPSNVDETDVVVIDPMLATAGSVCAAIKCLREHDVTAIKVLCLLATPEGIENLFAAHDHVSVFTAAVDTRLDERGYIVPGLGDAGDRLYGTR
ncbi:MAG: uracil phosphoribosyltransferase [Planctomycetota bacterium]|jgi:uracil phosphoribosyltransferase